MASFAVFFLGCGKMLLTCTLDLCLLFRDLSVFAHVLDTHYGAPNINYKGKSYSFDWEV